MKILFYIVLIISVFSFSGCSAKWSQWPWTETQIFTDYQYLKRPIPELQEKPVADDYTMFQSSFNGVDYYVMTKYDAGIMDSNYGSYSNWCETNYNILVNMKDNDTKVSKGDLIRLGLESD